MIPNACPFLARVATLLADPSDLSPVIIVITREVHHETCGWHPTMSARGTALLLLVSVVEYD